MVRSDDSNDSDSDVEMLSQMQQVRFVLRMLFVGGLYVTSYQIPLSKTIRDLISVIANRIRYTFNLLFPSYVCTSCIKMFHNTPSSHILTN